MLGVVALVAVTSAIFIVVRATNASADVSLEAVKTPGANPFMANVGVDELAAAQSTTPPDAKGRFPADTVGLYGGTMNKSSCDRDKMLAFLKANPDKGRAWAGVVGIPFANLDSYVSDLTPVVLRVDTAVTNHGFASGKATELQSVLQAGTAVLVDKFGTPVAKCYCGNPLTPPAAYAKAKYTGSPWSRFTKDKIVIVQSTRVVIDTFALVDVQTNKAFDRPRASTGSRDTPRTASPSRTTAPPGSSTFTEQDAITLFNERDASCSTVRYPWPAQESAKVSTRTTDTPGVFIVVIVHSPGGRTFEFQVDPANKRMSPVNDQAQTAAQHCPAFNR